MQAVAANNHNELKLRIAKIILNSLDNMKSDHGLDLNTVYSSIVSPPNAKMGDFAFPCFQLAKSMKQAPPKIAAKILEGTGVDSWVDEFLVAGPYLNTRVSLTGWQMGVIDPIVKGDFFKRKIKAESPKTMIEYSQPNTHKELHVGHTRNLCLGNALVRILRYTQDNVISATYPGDMGTHVAKCLWYLKFHNTEEIPSENPGAWLGKIYTKAHLKLENELGSGNEDSNRTQLTQILTELESGKGEFFELWQKTRQWSIDLMKNAYSWSDVEFDRWYFESEVDSDSLAYVRELEKKKIAIIDQGALGVDLNESGLGFCILIKSDGNGLYATKDLELARRKFSEGILRNYYVVDFRQSHHFQQVFKILELAGELAEPRMACHISYEMVDMPDGAMSSRKGNIIPLMDLVENMQKMIRQNYLTKFEGNWSSDEIDQTAKDVANGAIKYGMLRVDNNRKLTFEMDEWLRLDGETGPYLQYVHARINSLIEKSKKSHIPEQSIEALSHSLEKELMAKLSWFNDIVEQCADQHKTLHLTAYLYSLGKLFNSFYAECPIAKADDENVRGARLKLSFAVAETIRHGLDLLGIPAPRRM